MLLKVEFSKGGDGPWHRAGSYHASLVGGVVQALEASGLHWRVWAGSFPEIARVCPHCFDRDCPADLPVPAAPYVALALAVDGAARVSQPQPTAQLATDLAVLWSRDSRWSEGRVYDARDSLLSTWRQGERVDGTVGTASGKQPDAAG